MCFFTIIVPVYNSEKTVCRCIDSILHQRYTDFELILIDDGSIDQSGIICDRYQKKDHRVIVYHQQNRGVSAARNYGLNNAKGEWVSFIDSDDWIESSFLSDFLSSIVKLEGVDLLVQGFYMHRSGKKSIKVHYNEEVLEPFDALNQLYADHMPGALWNKLFKKAIIEKHQIKFNESFIFKEDEDFILSYLLHSHLIYFCNSINYQYYLPDWKQKYKKDSYIVSKHLYETIVNYPIPTNENIRKNFINALSDSILNSFIINIDPQSRLHDLYTIRSIDKKLIQRRFMKVIIMLPEIIAFYLLKIFMLIKH